MRSKCHLIGQCLVIYFETILDKDSLSRGGVIAEILQGGTGRHRKMAAFFLRAVQGGVVGKGLNYYRKQKSS